MCVSCEVTNHGMPFFYLGLVILIPKFFNAREINNDFLLFTVLQVRAIKGSGNSRLAIFLN